MATATKTKGIAGLCCPLCGSTDETILLDLTLLGSCRCEDCGESFAVEAAIERAEKALAAWRKVAKIVEFGRELAGE